MSDNVAFDVDFNAENPNWTRDPEANWHFLVNVQNHMSDMLAIRGHVFMNDVFDVLRLPRTKLGQTHGWVYVKDERERVTWVFTDLKDGNFVLTFNTTDILDVLP